MRWLRPLFALLVLAWSGCQKAPDPAASARQFFELIASGRTQTAWQSAAFGLQAQRSAVVFEATAKEMGLTEYAGGDWQAPEIDGKTAKVRVTVKTRTGLELPLIITLNQEAGAWRVYSIRQPPNEKTGVSENRFTLIGKIPAFTDAVTQPVPPEAEVRQIVQDNLLRFNDAIVAQSFDAFYDSVSAKWQDQLTKGQLQRAFQPFIDKKVTLDGIRNIAPVFDNPPTVGTDGLLLVSGHYPTKPYRVHFALKLLYELPTWKLFGLDVNLRQ